ncbi:hypothetical protein ACIBHX_01970 [Nonomuraea sp. NPDC050536]|uniref:hypothetical protein n=1 Tax=Nonomuraea sp. NPDC050536 TaxID=3364366 RepID=UPI0037C5C08A
MPAAPHLTGLDASADLLTYDPRFRCTCTRPHGYRCIRKATEEDLLCDDCRHDRHAVDQIRYVSEPALRNYPEQVAQVLGIQRGHAILIPPGR